jgi:hypothetical protein
VLLRSDERRSNAAVDNLNSLAGLTAVEMIQDEAIALRHGAVA